MCIQGTEDGKRKKRTREIKKKERIGIAEWVRSCYSLFLLG
jgi:hypothetical protein